MDNKTCYFHIFTFFVFAILFAPYYISYEPLQVHDPGFIAAYNETSPLPGSWSYRDNNDLLNKSCYLWKNIPNITHIKIWPLNNCYETEYYSHSGIFYIYLYLTIELVVFFLFLSFATYEIIVPDTNWMIRLFLSLFFISWFSGIIFDIFATTEDYTIGKLVHGNMYNMVGKTFIQNPLDHNTSYLPIYTFNNQYSYINSICYIEKYLWYISKNHLSVSFDNCTLTQGFEQVNISSIISKSVSLFFLLMSSIMSFIICIQMKYYHSDT